MLGWLQVRFRNENVCHNFERNGRDLPRESVSRVNVPPAMLKALQIPLITDEIFKYLTLGDLLECRLVDRSWNVVTSDFVMRRDMCRVELVYSYDQQIYRRSQFTPEMDERNGRLCKNFNLSNLNKILAKSFNFPSSHFEFQFGNLAQPEAQEFFKIQSTGIKTLVLRQTYFYDVQPIKNKFSKSTNWQKYLVALPCDGSNVKSKRVKRHPLDSTEFPLLNTFHWMGSVQPSPVLKILVKSNNLEVIPTVNFPQETADLVQMDMVPLIQSLTLVDFKGTTEDLLHLLSGHPNLKRLTYFVHKSQAEGDWIRAVNILLSVCRDSLEWLGSGGLCALDGIQVPTLTRLKTLQLLPSRRMHSDNVHRCFLPDLNLQEKFPNLVTLDVHSLPCGQTGNWESFFPDQRPPFKSGSSGNLTTVTTLKISDMFNELWLRKLHDLCPNFKYLSVHSRDSSLNRLNVNSNLHVILPKIFEMWSHLEKLELVVNRGGSRVVNTNLDAAMTGMSAVSCSGLRHFLIPQGKSFCDNGKLTKAGRKLRKKFESFKTGSSITDLKNLKRMNIQLAEVWDCMDSLCLTWVSGLFSFSQMPTTDINLIFHTRKYDERMLKWRYRDLVPYVQIKCKSTSCWRLKDVDPESI